MVSKSELISRRKEKFLFYGDSDSGKTMLSTLIADIYAKNGKKVKYIDPEHGAEVSLLELDDSSLDNIKLVSATEWKVLKEELMKDSEDIDLLILDGLLTAFELRKFELHQRFKEQGYYVVADKKFLISDIDTFVFPFTAYTTVYDSVFEILMTMLKQKYDIVVTSHIFGDTDTQLRLKQRTFKLFDVVIHLKKELDSDNVPSWSGVKIKHRGGERPDKTNTIRNTRSVVKYFEKKFSITKGEKVDLVDDIDRTDVDSDNKKDDNVERNIETNNS